MAAGPIAMVWRLLLISMLSIPAALAGGSGDAEVLSLEQAQALMRLRHRLGTAPLGGDTAAQDKAIRLEGYLLRQRFEILGGSAGDGIAARRRMQNELWLLEHGAHRRTEPPRYRQNPGYGLPTLPE